MRATGPRGLCIWFTGMSGSGKTTTAVRLGELLEASGTVVTLLDGDVVRAHLLPSLGFSRAERDQNVLAVAWIAAQIVRHGGVVICSLISPYRETRAQARRLVGDDRFLEVFVDTPLDVCQARDTKGLYARARRGEIENLTGVSDPYEPPLAPELVLETVGRSVDENARTVLRAAALRTPITLRGLALEEAVASDDDR